MASPRAILAANKAVPGAAARTPAPQGAYPSIGMLNQAFSEPGSGYARAYGPPFLPRPPQTFTEGAFGPFSPILPVPIDRPPPGADRPQPRRWQYRVGYDLPVGEPGSEGYKLASFGTLKALSDYYSIARTCIEIRKNEIRALDWDIVLTPDAAKAYRGKPSLMKDFGERQTKLKKFFSKPDPNYFSFSSWLYAALEQVFVYDTLSLYMCPTRGGGRGTGVLGSGLDSLWLIDGSSVRPLVGLHGEVPQPPAVAFEQYIFGVPRSDYMTMIDRSDLQDAGLTSSDLTGEWRGDQLLYLPYVPRADSPYGFSMVEQCIIPIMTGLRKQAYQLSFFDENSIPGVYISPGDVSMTPNQVKELQLALNAIAGQNAAWNFKVIVLPPGSKTMPQKQMEIVDQADEWIATEVAMVFNINPMEIGVLPKISTVASPFAAREMAQAQRSIHERTSTKPTLKFMTEIANLIIQKVLGQEDCRWLFSGMEEDADLAAQTDMGIKQIQTGALSIDEFRDATGRVPWGLPETTEPIIVTQNGPIPLSVASQLASANLAQTLAGPAPSSGGDTGAHHAAQGATGKKPTPVGTSGQGRMNGPVTQRQARRGGALAPAHATAEGAPGHSGGKAATVVPAAAQAELEALARHLGKGRHITTWEARHIPADVLEMIARDLSDGLSPDAAVNLACNLVLGASEYEWADKAAGQSPKARKPPRGGGTQANQQQQQAQQQAAQARQQALAAQYAARVQQAFAAAAGQAARLIAQWTAGTLAVTAAVLAGMIAALFAKELGKALRALWRKAWQAGRTAAQDAGGGTMTPRAAKEALDAFLATFGAEWTGRISQTRIDDLARELRGLAGLPQDQLLARLAQILGLDFRAPVIARTEVMRAWNAAALDVFRFLGIAYKVWRTHSGHPCPACIKAAASPPLPLAALFPGVNVPAPLAHPNCQCTVEPALVQGQPVTAVKGLRRQVDLNGEVTYHDEDVPQENAAGGGSVPPRSHVTTGNGVQQDIPGSTPGISAGGEPPRWDGTQPFPYVRDVEGGDDASQGGPRGLGSRPGRDWPSGYMDEFRGWWPQGGHGTQQPPGMEVGTGGPRGRPPNSVGKAANAEDFLRSAPKAKASQVFAQLSGNYPPQSIAWVRRASWHGPSEVPLPLIDWSGRKRWAADKETSKVDEFARQLRAKEHVNPVVAIAEPGKRRYRLIDGHHRALACKELGWPVRAWIAEVADPGDLKAAWETHASQSHQGSSEQNKSFTAGATGGAGVVSGLVPLGAPVKQPKQAVSYRKADYPARSCGTCYRFVNGDTCTSVAGRIKPGDVCDLWTPRDAAKGAKPDGPHVAGLMVRAADTGRVLMLQRAIDDDQDYAAGMWEPPGGHQEPGETLLQAAMREFSEETGFPAPSGALTGSWDGGNGIYRGFVVEVPSEDTLPIFDGRDQVWDPDDPKGDHTQAIAWWDPRQFRDNPSVRPEMSDDLEAVLAALGSNAEKSAETPMLEATPDILGPHGLWHTPDRHTGERQKLPNYIEHIAHALMRDQGVGESQAIATAINAVKRWARGDLHWGRGKVTPEVIAASQRALNEWEELRASHAG